MSKSYSLSSAVTLALLSISAIGCATGGGGNAGGSSFVRMDVGVAQAQDLIEQTNDLLRRESFQILRTDPIPAPLFETEWRNQNPTEDEQALGVTEIQCRILVRGRERPPNGSMRIWQVTYTMETLVRTLTSPDWSEMPVTPQRRILAREIGQELRTLLEVARR